MAARPGFFGYVKAAFNARPMGMFVAPNWVGLVAFGLLGFANPGFWIVGGGLELGYLLALATNPRFQRAVAARPLLASKAEWSQRIERMLGRLDPGERRRYETLAERCRSIIDLQLHGAAEPPHGLEGQAESLGRLSWMFLRLLLAHRTIRSVVGESDSGGLEKRMAELQRQQRSEGLSEELRRSLAGQLEILTQRVQQRADAARQLTIIDAELQRIEQQVELVREQAALSTDPDLVSRRIDEVAATLGTTGQWIRDQQQVFGAMEDLLTEPPPLVTDVRAKETQ